MDTPESLPLLKVPDSEELFEFLLEQIPDVIFFKDRHSRFICANRAMLQQFGLTSLEEIIGKTDFDFLLPDDAQRTLQDEQRVLQTGEPIIERITRKAHSNGRIWWSLTTKLPLKNAQGEIVGTCGISKDVTQIKNAEEALKLANAELERTLAERKLQEKHIQQVTRLYAAMSLMYQTILGAQSREELFCGLCRTLVESAQFDMAWVGLVKPGDPQVEMAAQYGDNFNYLHRVQIFHDQRAEGCGPVGTSIREDVTQVINNFQENPMTAPWHEDARHSDWKSCASVPIHIGDKVAGALVVYSKTPHYFSDREVILLERAAADISSALKMVDALAALRP